MTSLNTKPERIVKLIGSKKFIECNGVEVETNRYQIYDRRPKFCGSLWKLLFILGAAAYVVAFLCEAFKAN